MAKYSIQDTSLIAIGDAIRNKTGEHTRPGIEKYMKTIPEVIVSKTPNANGFSSSDVTEAYPRGTLIDVISFPGADSIYVDCAIEVFWKDGREYVQFAPGEYDDTNFPVDETEKHYFSGEGDYKYIRKQLTFSNTDVITARFVGLSSMYYVGYYAECKAFDADGNPMGEYQVELEREVEVKNTLTPAQMATEIEELPTYDPPAEALEWSGDLSYKLRNGHWDWFVNDFGDRITTKDVKILNYFAYAAKSITRLPFDINISDTFSSASSAFTDCYELVEVPRIVGKITNGKKVDLDYLFNNCKKIKEIPYDYFHTFGGVEYWTSCQQLTSGNRSSIFNGCSSLRKLPDISMLKTKIAYYNCLYNSLCVSCISLESIDNLPILENDLTTNALNRTAVGCYRLKSFTFETNENGTPKTANWKSQSFDLSDSVGYANKIYYNDMVNYGNSTEKQIVDDATYQALKDDPDSWTINIDYSRYNKLSAIETINSLPNTSAYGTNIIKFKGAAGTLTDSGAINTLTEEEIAVAAAKGWTVTLV